jgi:hypothetical protein
LKICKATRRIKIFSKRIKREKEENKIKGKGAEKNRAGKNVRERNKTACLAAELRTKH